MWWLGLAAFLIYIIERAPIDDDATYQWFNEFTIRTYRVVCAEFMLMVQQCSSLYPPMVLSA